MIWSRFRMVSQENIAAKSCCAELVGKAKSRKTSAERFCALCFAFLVLLALNSIVFARAALAQPPQADIHVRLDQANQKAQLCQLIFVLENSSKTELKELQFELVLFDSNARVIRLSLLDFLSLPADSMRVRSFGFPDMQCSNIGKILFNNVGKCVSVDALSCKVTLSVESETSIEVLQ